MTKNNNSYNWLDQGSSVCNQVQVGEMSDVARIYIIIHNIECCIVGFTYHIYIYSLTFTFIHTFVDLHHVALNLIWTATGSQCNGTQKSNIYSLN